MTTFARGEKESPAAPILLLLLIVVVGAADWLTGVDYGFSLFYIIGILIAGWRFSPGWVVAAVALSATAWFAAQVAFAAPDGMRAVYWNGFARLLIYSAFGYMAFEIRADRMKLKSLNADLQAALAAQTELARTDPLTRLPNARSFTERLALRLERSAESRIPLCIAYVDIDNFKEVNDRYGHGAGDQALQKIAEVLAAAIRSTQPEREGDFAARLGGDEFGIVFSGISSEAAFPIANRIIARIGALGSAYPGAGLGASVGLSCAVPGSRDAEDLIRRADRAMYESKASGKGRVVIAKESSGILK
ncbi:MAG TPA: GGDEF domain-containing protein [Thermoanaerobaculia bacterium]|nr:GGDEF domain-containing protein [Thermoanaerobaculia bacterium]